MKRKKKSGSGKEKREKIIISLFTLCQRQSLEKHHSNKNIKLWLKSVWNCNNWSTLEL